MAWQKLRASLEPEARIFYRHRHRNIGRKSGNIQDFCENWGSLYDYMVMLDADSLMTGETLASAGPADGRQSPRRADPGAATLVGRSTLFARIQQFASSVYGPIYNAGLALLQAARRQLLGPQRHHPGARLHAAWRTAASLPGKPPFGGEIMSHDFVEAAFLRAPAGRSGWRPISAARSKNRRPPSMTI